MARYDFESVRGLMDSRPEVFQRILAAGRLDDTHTVIELPDGFDFEGQPPLLADATKELRGLGDAVAMIAKPIARIIDGIAGTNLTNCGGCAQRQAALNKAISFKKD